MYSSPTYRTTNNPYGLPPTPEASLPNASLPPRIAPVQGPPREQDAYENPVLWPDQDLIKGVMAPTQFINAIDAYTDQVVILAGCRTPPPEEEAQRIEATKITGSTVNYLLLGAPAKFREARRAPKGSEQRRHAFIDSGIRGAVALAVSPTVVIPIVSGLLGFAKGQHAVNNRGLQRIYQRKMIKQQVLQPMLKMLKEASPIPLQIEHRAKIRAFLDVCNTNPAVKHVLKPYDTQPIEKWLADADRI